MTKLQDVILRDTTANRPAAGTAGRLFYDTTLSKLQRDNGSTWDDVEGAGGSSGPAGQIGYAQVTATATVATSTQTDMSGLSVTVTVGTRPIKVTGYIPNVNNSSGSGALTYLQIYDSTAAAVLQQTRTTEVAAGDGGVLIAIAANLAPGAGSRTYKLRWATGGSGTSTLNVSSTSPAFILVEEC